jgi:DNA-binding transcriptional ArsR family regulator
MYLDSSKLISPDIQQDVSDELAAMCKALGHPARIKILKHLLKEDHCICGRIVEVLPLAQSTVSQHLKILKESGLVQGEVEGPKTCYCVDKDKLNKLFETMSAFFKQENIK